MGDKLNYYGSFVKQFQVWVFVCSMFLYIFWLIPKHAKFKCFQIYIYNFKIIM
jgi:hypothetical protein